VPIITTAVGGMQEIADNECDRVTLVSPDDTDALADAIAGFFADRPDSTTVRKVDGSQNTSSRMRLVDLIEAMNDGIC